jgi:hypothetical protein
MLNAPRAARCRRRARATGSASVRRDDAAGTTHGAASGTIPALFVSTSAPAQPGDHHSPAANAMTSPT